MVGNGGVLAVGGHTHRYSYIFTHTTPTPFPTNKKDKRNNHCSLILSWAKSKAKSVLYVNLKWAAGLQELERSATLS